MLVVNFFSGPGAGKSTLAAGTFAELKNRQVSCELVTEYAKDLVWDESLKLLEDSILVFAEQHRRISRLDGKVDIVLTDSPLLLSLVYASDSMGSPFSDLVLQCHFRWPSYNVFVDRIKPYHEAGRIQSEEEARSLDKEIRLFLHDNSIPFRILNGERASIAKLADTLSEMVGVK